MFKRKIYDEMKKWKEESDGMSALLIEGARRIGKSTVVTEFAKNEYKEFLLIDFSICEEAIKTNFDNIGNLDMFFRNLFVLMEKVLPVGQSLIVFDEV